MENLIYFPTFEPPSNIWLKFALLYIENFKPIIPYSRQHLISDDFRLVENETDLVTPYSPTDNDGYLASLRAIEETEGIIKQTYYKSPLFRRINILRNWQDPTSWRFLVYREKFTNDWLYFCEQHRIGIETNEGILLPEELAFLFMTYLAKEIAFKEAGAIITDSVQFDDFTNYTRSFTPLVNKRMKFAKGIINLILPKNLNAIPLHQIIQFRNRNRALISAFNSELRNVQEKIAVGYNEKDFINSYNDIYSEYSRGLLTEGLGIASIPLAAYILIQNNLATTPEYIKEILGSLGIILGGTYTINKALKDTKTKRYCKKYLVNLERLY